jgi:UDP:flavonoid glycosyltransferase YjiC (YdhE family)
VLAEPSYREAARRIADEFREYGTGERAAVLLESLVAEKVRTRH